MTQGAHGGGLYVVITSYGKVTIGRAMREELERSHGAGYFSRFCGLSRRQLKSRKWAGLVRDIEGVEQLAYLLSEWHWRLGRLGDGIMGDK